MNARIMRWMAPGLVVLGLAACGGPASSGPASPGGSPTPSGGAAAQATTAPEATTAPPASAQADVANPCALTTPSAVAAAFGGTVAAGKVVPDVVGKACWYQVTASNLGVSGHILITPLASLDAQTFAEAKKLPGEVDVPGVGDDAIYLAATATMEILKGNTVVNAQPLFSSGGQPVSGAKVKADTIALARSIAASL
jgi:Protein of unknown function (DUF3558)